MSFGGLQIPSLFLSTGDPATVNDTTTTGGGSLFIPEQVGKIATVYPKSSYWNTFSLGNLPLTVQYIKRSATDATTIAVGSVAYWKDYDDFVVTSDASDAYDTVGTNHWAGFFLGTVPAAGNYGCIAVAGIAPILVPSSPTGTADTTGRPIVTDGGDNDCDILVAWSSATLGTGVAKCLSAKDTPSGIGTNVVKGLILSTSRTVL